MANANTKSAKRLIKEKLAVPVRGAQAAEIYDASIEVLYPVARTFCAEPSATELVQACARELHFAAEQSGYTRYSKLLALRVLFDLLKARAARKPEQLLPITGLTELSFEEAFTLLLRDRFGFSAIELSAVIGLSEGSIRTRLERARARGFSASNESMEYSKQATVSDKAHACIQTRALIEDGAEGAVSKCPRCDQLVKLRAASVAFFKKLPSWDVPTELRTFPIAPVLRREGKRLFLNWSAAPWYLKALVEGSMAMALVLVVVLSVPRAKALYELWMERRFDLYNIAELAMGLSERPESAPIVSSETPAPTSETASSVTARAPYGPNLPGAEPAPLPAERLIVKAKSEFAGRDSEVPAPDSMARILIKIDAPETIRGEVLRILNTGPYTAADKEAPNGAELPGGILFDVFVPTKAYKAVVNDLVRLGETQILITRSRQRGIPGKARMKIWLQRI